ncbi:MAG: TetR family transcriptional regulator C-terminal domain-containing protein [Pseudomonadota bacterium]
MNDASPPQTRIQREKRELILEAALEVFSTFGFRGATLDQIAQQAGISKPNLLYYFPSKEAIHTELLDRLMDSWLAPLDQLDPAGEPRKELRAYILRKLEMSRDFPRESRLFANEIIHGAPRSTDALTGRVKSLVDEKAEILKHWMAAGKLTKMDPHHLIFAIWATTQHYADFDVQVRAVLGRDDEGRFHDAADFLERLFFSGLDPRA